MIEKTVAIHCLIEKYSNILIALFLLHYWSKISSDITKLIGKIALTLRSLALRPNALRHENSEWATWRWYIQMCHLVNAQCDPATEVQFFIFIFLAREVQLQVMWLGFLKSNSNIYNTLKNAVGSYNSWIIFVINKN